MSKCRYKCLNVVLNKQYLEAVEIDRPAEFGNEKNYLHVPFIVRNLSRTFI